MAGVKSNEIYRAYALLLQAQLPGLLQQVLRSQDNARIVGVGFLSGLVVKHAPSVTNRFLTSWAWQKPFRTAVLASDPMRTVPTSCATPPGCRWPQRLDGEPVSLTGVPPAASMIARKVSFMSAAILTSLSLQVK